MDKYGRAYIIEAVAYIVPRSDRFPSGTKYSFHAGYVGDGGLILRYDNANDSHVSKHHKHYVDGQEKVVEPVEFKPKNSAQLVKLFKEWKEEVKIHAERR